MLEEHLAHLPRLQLHPAVADQARAPWTYGLLRSSADRRKPRAPGQEEEERRGRGREERGMEKEGREGDEEKEQSTDLLMLQGPPV